MILCGSVILISPLARVGMDGRILATNTLLNLDGLAFGAILALLFRPDRRLMWTGISAVALTVGAIGALLSEFRPTPLLASYLASMFAGAVTFALLAADSTSLYARFLRAGWLRYLGIISYGLYLLHGWASICVSGAGVDRYLTRFGGAGDLATVVVRIAASIVLATISWHLLERPLLRFKTRFPSGGSATAKTEALALVI